MKKIQFILLLLVCLFPLTALAEGFALDESAVLAGMNDRSWAQGYAPTVKNDTLTIHVPVHCEQAIGKITATLEMADETVTPLRPQALSAEYTGANGAYAVVFNLKLHKNRVNGDYPAMVRIKGADGGGNALTGDIPVVLRIRDGLPNEDAPRPALSEVTAELKLGEETIVTAILENASRSAEMTNVTLILTDATGDIVPGESNILRLPDLLPGEKCEIVYPVSVKPGASVSPHGVRFELAYTYLGQNGLWQETFTLPVTQDMRLEKGELDLAGTVVQGDAVTATLPLMNMGRSELRNVMAAIRVPGIVDRQSVLVGSLAAGETKYAKMSLSPGKNALGAFEGEIVVTYEDAWANAGSFSLPISITVEAPAVKTSATLGDESAEEEETPWLVYGLAGGCGLLLLLLILQGAIYRKKIHTLEEDTL